MPDGVTSTSPARPRILVTVGTFEPGYRGGGPARSVATIVSTLVSDAEIYVLTRDRDIGDRRPYAGLSGRYIARGRAKVFYLNPHSPRQVLTLVYSMRQLRIDAVYLNGLWDPVFSIAIILMTVLRLLSPREVLLAPRGELSPGAMQIRQLKKRMAVGVLRPLLSMLNVTWHASSELEARHIRRNFQFGEMLINTNPTTLPARAYKPAVEHTSILSLVFISRISPKKNLLMAIRAVSLTRSPITFDIYGPVEDAAYWRLCRKLIESCPSLVDIRYRGELLPPEVPKVFAKYDYFIFPTLGENFGHVIAESLSAACPVICTDTTPWTATLRAGGGIIVDGSRESLRLAIEGLATLTPETRHLRRITAGRAYESWRREQVAPNILDAFLPRLRVNSHE